MANFLKKMKKKMLNQHHMSIFAGLDGGGGYSGKKINYEDANQTGNFIWVKTENDIYDRGEKHY